MPSYLPWSLLLLLLLLLLSGCLFLRLLLLLLLLLLLFCFFWSDVEECGGGGRAVCQSRPLIDGRRPSLVFLFVFFLFFLSFCFSSFVRFVAHLLFRCLSVCLFVLFRFVVKRSLSILYRNGRRRRPFRFSFFFCSRIHLFFF